jgi:hypothetical protein
MLLPRSLDRQCGVLYKESDMTKFSFEITVGRLLVASAIFAIAIVFATLGIERAYAQPHTASIPKAWGSVKGTLAAFLVLEDGNGVIRIVRQSDGALYSTYTRN